MAWTNLLDELKARNLKKILAIYISSSLTILAGIHAIRCDSSEAIRLLERAVEMGFRDYRWLRVDPMFSGIKTTPEFSRIMADLEVLAARMREDAAITES